MLPIFSQLYKHVYNIPLEGTMSQILYLMLSFDFMLKNGKIFVDFIKHNFLHLIKQRLRLI